jgi:hypothetical protein
MEERLARGVGIAARGDYNCHSNAQQTFMCAALKVHFVMDAISI